jgi:hypothetical protein
MQASKLEKMAPINPSDPQDNVIYKRQGSELRHLTYLTIFVQLIQAFYFGGVYAKETNDNQMTYRDFNLNIGDRIESLGALTRNARWIDLSLEIEKDAS